jgi:hypothetical protein
VTDDNGGIGFDSVVVVVTNVAPTGALDGPAAVDEGQAYTLVLGPAMDPGVDSITQYRVSWGDGTPLELFTPVQLNALNRTLTHTFANQGTPVITIAMVDEDGVHANSGSKTVTVRNVAPVITVLAGSTAVLSENDLLTLTGSISDPGSVDFQTVRIDWGDGTAVQNVVLPVGVRTFSVDHRYVDDNPSGILTDTFTITVRVNDQFEDSATRTTRVVVDNTAPSIGNLIVSPTTLVENQSVNVSGIVFDPGTLDNPTVTVDWGDGSAVQTLALNVAKAFSGSHLYAVPGSYTLFLIASDDDGGVLTVARSVTVDDLPPVVVASDFGSVGAGALFVRSGSFTDASGPEDAWTATVAFDDGPALPLALNPDKTFLIQHVFTTVGLHAVTIIVSDRFGRSGERTFAVNVQPTGTGPVVLGSQVNDGQLQRSRLAGVAVQFSENVGASLGAADMTLRNVTIATNVSAASLTFDFNTTTNTWTIGPATGVTLPAGNYRLTVLAGGILDNGGQPLAANTVLDFHILPGDANGDRTVNDRDLYLVWQNTFLPPANQNSNADLTGDGFANAADLLVVRSHYLTTLPSVSPQGLNTLADGDGSPNLVQTQFNTTPVPADNAGEDGDAPSESAPTLAPPTEDQAAITDPQIQSNTHRNGARSVANSHRADLFSVRANERGWSRVAGQDRFSVMDDGGVIPAQSDYRMCDTSLVQSDLEKEAKRFSRLLRIELQRNK